MVRVGVDQLGSTEPSSRPAPRRFSPVRDQNSRRVPVLYTGADLACALGETVFHDLGDDTTDPAEVFRADLLALRAGTIAVTVDCQVADLTDEALARYGYRRDEVIDTTSADYPITRRWGQLAWDTTGCAGLVWNSRRSPERLSFMFFVNPPRVDDRGQGLIRRQNLDVVAPPTPLYDGDGLAGSWWRPQSATSPSSSDPRVGLGVSRDGRVKEGVGLLGPGVPGRWVRRTPAGRRRYATLLGLHLTLVGNGAEGNRDRRGALVSGLRRYRQRLITGGASPMCRH